MSTLSKKCNKIIDVWGLTLPTWQVDGMTQISFYALQSWGSLHNSNIFVSGSIQLQKLEKKHLNGAEIALDPSHTLAATFIY